MKCKHQNADHLKPGECLVRWDDIGRPEQIHVEQFRCLECGAWLSLGPASLCPPVEIRLAAMLACHFADDHPCRCFDRRRLLRDVGDEKEVRRVAMEIIADRTAA